MSDWLDLQGGRVLVAGGGGTIGIALVDGLRRVGASVAAIDADLQGLRPRADEWGLDDRLLQADLRDPNECQRSVAAAREILGGLDVLIHAVGINVRKPIEQFEPEEWSEILETNVSSAFWTAQAALPGFAEQKHGRVVLLSSVAGRSGHKNHGPYAASKGAINQLARVMAHEYADRGVTVNAVAPGYMETALTERYLRENPGQREKLLGLIPAGRFGRAEEVVGPVLFLASGQAGFITGQILYVDGGRSVL